MKDSAWRRRANPWSVWTSFAAIPAMIVAVWSQVWLGWVGALAGCCRRSMARGEPPSSSWPSMCRRSGSQRASMGAALAHSARPCAPGLPDHPAMADRGGRRRLRLHH